MPTNVDDYRHIVATNILAAVEGKAMDLDIVRTELATSQSGSALDFISDPQSKFPNLSQIDTGFVVNLRSNPLRLTLTASADSLRFADVFPGYRCDSTNFGQKIRWLWSFLDSFEPTKLMANEYVNATPIYPLPPFLDCRVITRNNKRKRRPNTNSQSSKIC